MCISFLALFTSAPNEASWKLVAIWGSAFAIYPSSEYSHQFSFGNKNAKLVARLVCVCRKSDQKKTLHKYSFQKERRGNTHLTEFQIKTPPFADRPQKLGGKEREEVSSLPEKAQKEPSVVFFFPTSFANISRQEKRLICMFESYGSEAHSEWKGSAMAALACAKCDSAATEAHQHQILIIGT